MTMETEVAKLQAQQQAISEDVGDMKRALSSIAESLRNLPGIEQRQVSLTESIARAHKRVNEIQDMLKDEVKSHEKRLHAIEITMAKNQWIERLITGLLMAAIGLWIKGGI